MHNKEETVKIVGFVAPFFDMRIKLFNFFPLSVVQLVIFIAFSAICTGAFFAIKALLNIGNKAEKEVKETEGNESNAQFNAIE